METALYRIVQEALTNVAKHAKATSVRIELERGGQGFRCVIRDDGCGFDVSGIPARQGQRGLGTLGILERLEALGGKLQISSAPGAGDKVRFGRTRPDVNHYLKWAFGEAANVICLNRRHWPGRHVARLYDRVHQRRGHQKAIGAVARHLAEATYWILAKEESYREPRWKPAASTKA